MPAGASILSNNLHVLTSPTAYYEKQCTGAALKSLIMTVTQLEMPQGHAASDSGVELYQNSPNPFIEMTLLWFRLPALTEVVLRIFNQQGKEVAAKTGVFGHGESHFVIHRADLREPGFYTARLETPYGTASRRMMMY